MPKKGWITSAIALIIFFGIMCGGPRLKAFLIRKYKEGIDKNGTEVKAQVYLKKSHKGKSTYFRYHYKNRLYKNDEQSTSIFEAVEIGDSIMVLVDSTKPSDSYIISIGNY
jgi:hypothetical protein